MSPDGVVRRAPGRRLRAMALTDHDTLAGVPEALAAGERYGVRVVGGCEFSVAAPWGEMHVLGYLLPSHSAELEAFLERCRADRVRRAQEMVSHLQRLGWTSRSRACCRSPAVAPWDGPTWLARIVRHGGAADAQRCLRPLPRAGPSGVRREDAPQLCPGG